MTISPYGRGTCPVRDRDIFLTKAGKVRHHGAKNNSWPPRNRAGWGLEPKENT
jgi:hypothetical protein